ncbi:MAG: sigma-54-dependent Fis family transcriptional regulator [Chitinophagaceae bacterium]|nr:MAG: sigma-54-dependent Fis family transcriptional regulator [Chitinophagaceae bacterium]
MMLSENIGRDSWCINVTGTAHVDPAISRFNELLCRKRDGRQLPLLLFGDTIPCIETLSGVCKRLHAAKNGSALILVTRKQLPKNIVPWDYLDIGVQDIVEWTNEEDMLAYVFSFAEREKMISEILCSSLIRKNLIGNSDVWRSFLRNIIEAALFSQGAILLQGESGTGKELISRLVHTLDNRPGKKDLIVVDCTTIVADLAGSELFGHEKGSYTNALQTRDGAFALANEGTLLLDEVGELPLGLQAELLRVIQEGTYKRVGSNTWKKTFFRLVCATNRNVRDMVTSSNFRQDLFYRISDFEFRVPSLRDRREDIPMIANHFLEEFYKKTEVPVFDEEVMGFLVQREYLGNVRELRQLVRRICLKHISHKKITIGEIPQQDRPDRRNKSHRDLCIFEETLRNALLSGASLRDLKNKTMDEAIRISLEISMGNKQIAARKLGVTLRAIQQFLKKYKLPANDK